MKTIRVQFLIEVVDSMLTYEYGEDEKPIQKLDQTGLDHLVEQIKVRAEYPHTIKYEVVQDDISDSQKTHPIS